MSAGRQISQASKQTIKNKQCGSNPPKGVPQAELHKSVDSASQGGYSWPIANWEQRYATHNMAGAGEERKYVHSFLGEGSKLLLKVGGGRRTWSFVRRASRSKRLTHVPWLRFVRQPSSSHAAVA